MNGKTAPWFECTPWSEPGVVRRYKYKGYIIEYIEQSCHNQCSVYWHHEFRALKDGKVVTNGGRVLGVTAKGNDLKEARANAYKATEWISFENKYMRHDIGKAIDEQ
jgi:phosphoribosylamine--glycine ligase